MRHCPCFRFVRRLQQGLLQDSCLHWRSLAVIPGENLFTAIPENKPEERLKEIEAPARLQSHQARVYIQACLC